MTTPQALPRILLRTAIAALLLLAGTTTAAAPAEAGPACDHPSSSFQQIGSLSSNTHPLVMVHGWTANGEGMRSAWTLIDQRIPNTFQARLFDYSNANTDWAASPRIASCLAAYLRAVSQAHRDSGGDGRVFVVAHSMGGLAARFATANSYAGHPAGPDIVAGVTTIDTPHLGSPFGNTEGAALWQWWNELHNKDLLPEHRSDAVRCLAIHDRTHPLPHGCAVAPYLPAGVSLGQISGDNVVRRTLFGVGLYDIDLRSDGVVGVDSATGYLPQSGPSDTTAPHMTSSYMKDVSCTVTTDETMALLRSFTGGAISPSMIRAVLAAFAFLANDSAILDQINSGQLGPNLAVLLVIAAVLYPCSHNAMLTRPDSINAVAESLRAQLADTGQPKITTLRPFGHEGNLAAGWSLDNRSTGPIDCQFGSPSPSAVDADIQECAPVAATADSCLILPTGTTALCLADPFTTKIVRNAVTGKAVTAATAPRAAVPIGIVLDDGTKCRRRIGGSWSTPDAKPDYVGFYGCTQGSSFQAVWGPANGTGIAVTPNGWTVEVGGEHSALIKHRIAEAFYVGLSK